MKTALIIQARMGSSRLPGKVLKPLGQTVALDYVVSRCRMVPGIMTVVVATSVSPRDDAIEAWCQRNEVAWYRGSEDDVLDRYYACAKQYEPDYVIRVTADCPFVDYHLAAEVVAAMEERPRDIALLSGDLPRGLAVEMLSFRALADIHQRGHEPRHREHVAYYAYEFPGEFTSTVIPVPLALRHPGLRITLDTEADYALLQAVAEHFSGDKLVPAQDVVDFLLAHPEIARLNAHVRQKPVV